MHRRDLLKLAAAAPAAAFAARPRMRSAICAYSFRDVLKDKSMSYEDLIRLSADLDVDGVDLTVYWFPNTSDEFLIPLKRLAYKLGVEIYSISVRSDMCKKDPAAQDAEIAALRDWVDVAQKLGAGHIRVFGGNVPKGETEDAAASWCVSVLGRAAAYAGSKGIILGLENHGGITEKASRILDIVKRVDSPWVGINADTGNFRTDAYSQFESLASHAVNVQLKSEVHGGGGKPEPSDWPRFLGILAKANYRGYVALEYEEKADARQAVPPLIAKLRKHLNQLG